MRRKTWTEFFHGFSRSRLINLFWVKFINLVTRPRQRKKKKTWGERDTIFLCWLLLHRQLSIQPTRGARSAQIRLASPSSESRLSRSEAGTQLTAFSQIPKILSPRFRCLTSFTPPGHNFYLGFYFDICEWRILPACTWTPALMFAPNQPMHWAERFSS